MKDALNPLGDALRSFLLRAREGPRTPPAPVAPPPGLEPPERISDAENGYVALTHLVRDWPSEGRAEPDLLHWRDRLAIERKPGERALAPLRPLLERIEPILNAPRWQITVGETMDWPELKPIRRLGQALLLRAALDDSPEDRNRAILLAQRLRRAQGPILHFLIGFIMERDAGGPFEGIVEDRKEAVRWDLARVVAPFAPRLGPWEPPLAPEFANSADERRSVAWALAGHPAPYDPYATVALYNAHRKAMEAAPSEELRRLSQVLIAPWPPELAVPGGFGGKAPLFALRRARLALRETVNPYGRLGVAQTLHILSGTVAAIERARKA